MKFNDKGLKIRMGIVMILMVLLYGGFVGILMLSELTIMLAAIIAPLAVITYKGPKIALKSTDGRKVSADEYTELHNRVGKLSQQADLPKPEIAVSDSKAPNAFVIGRSKDSTVLCVTEGLLDSLNGDELDAVIAHELSHIKNRDMTIMTVATTFAMIAYFIVRWGWMFDGGGQEMAPLYVAVLASFVVWIGSYVLIRILSSYREYVADRGGAKITGDPLSLANAIEKIDNTMDSVPKEDLRKSSGTQAINFYPVETGIMTEVMKTHPSSEDRIDKLESIEKELH